MNGFYHEDGQQILHDSQYLLRDMPDVLTIQELQNVLQISKSKAYNLVRHQEIKCFKVGRHIKIPKTYLIDFIEKNQYNGINQ